MKKDMRMAALPIVLLSIVVGIAGIACPEGGMTIRRWYFATPAPFHAVVAFRTAMGIGLILAASSSRWPRALRVLGGVACLQGLSATLLGLDRARAVMEWEGMQGSALLRAGAAVALASGTFIVFAVKQPPSEQRKQLTSINRAPDSWGGIENETKQICKRHSHQQNSFSGTGRVG
jgi:hypothetical protein